MSELITPAGPDHGADPLAGFALANVALSTDRPEALAAWYGDVLGFAVVSRAPGVEGVQTLVVERAGVRIDLISVPTQHPRPQPEDPPAHLRTQGLRNLVFWVDDLSAATRHVIDRGVQPLFDQLEVDGIGTAITAFRDPDGNLVAFWERRSNDPAQPSPRPTPSSGGADDKER